MKFSSQFLYRFWMYVEQRGPDECWGWRGSLSEQGYGDIGLDRRHYRAHRISWQIHNGAIPPGLFVLHKCDNPPCTNPHHLFLGTARDNTHDAMAKGRFLRRKGIPAPSSLLKKPISLKKAMANGSDPYRLSRGGRKLTARLVGQIRDLHRFGAFRQTLIARLFGISRQAVFSILAFKSWNHSLYDAQEDWPWRIEECSA